MLWDRWPFEPRQYRSIAPKSWILRSERHWRWRWPPTTGWFGLLAGKLQGIFFTLTSDDPSGLRTNWQRYPRSISSWSYLWREWQSTVRCLIVSWKAWYSLASRPFGLGGSDLGCLMKSWPLMAPYTWSIGILNEVASTSSLWVLERFWADLLIARLPDQESYLGDWVVSFVPWFTPMLGKQLAETQVTSSIWIYI